jgi:hypothetical protein
VAILQFHVQSNTGDDGIVTASQSAQHATYPLHVRPHFDGGRYLVAKPVARQGVAAEQTVASAALLATASAAPIRALGTASWVPGYGAVETAMSQGWGWPVQNCTEAEPTAKRLRNFSTEPHGHPA